MFLMYEYQAGARVRVLVGVASRRSVDALLDWPATEPCEMEDLPSWKNLAVTRVFPAA